MNDRDKIKLAMALIMRWNLAEHTTQQTLSKMPIFTGISFYKTLERAFHSTRVLLTEVLLTSFSYDELQVLEQSHPEEWPRELLLRVVHVNSVAVYKAYNRQWQSRLPGRFN